MKKIITFALAVALFMSFGGTVLTSENVCYAEEAVVNAPGADVLSIESKSACLMEPTTGKILFEKNADEKLRPASVTKIMTLLLVFEEIACGNMNYNDIVTISEHAASMGGSQCFFEAGEQQTVEDMIKCIVIASGNDAAVAMAEQVSGSEALFVEKMNEKARELGMINTHFENACGLEAEGHLTTARDIAIMSRELIVKHPDVLKYSTIWMDRIYHKTRKGETEFDLANTNKFLKQYNGAVGLKTGYTSQAKYCMSACAKREGVLLISVIMGADTKEIRNKEAGMLLDLGFAKCKIYADKDLGKQQLETEITGGIKKKIQCTIATNSNYFVTDQPFSDITRHIEYYEEICAPVREGDIVGKVRYEANGEVIYEIPVYAAESVDKSSYQHCIKSICSELFMMTRKMN